MDERSKQLLAQFDVAVAREESASKVYNDAKTSRHIAAETFLKHRWAIVDGMLVLWKGDVYKFVALDENSYSRLDPYRAERPWLMGYVRKKDGTFGSQLRRIYSEWEAV